MQPGLTKTGAGTLTLQVANNFTGPASVQSSTVDIGTFGSSLGNGALTLDNATIITINGGGFGNSSVTLVGTNTVQNNVGAATANAYGFPNLAGTGTLNVTSTIADKWFTINGSAQASR